MDILADKGTKTRLDSRVEQVRHRDGTVESVVASSESGNLVEYTARQFVSSMPLRELIHALSPPPPADVLSAARALRYRDYLTVVLIVDREHVFPDNWIYIHDPSVQMGRIQNYKNWSAEMVPDTAKTALGLEYFLWQDDDQWTWDEDRLIELGAQECARIGLVAQHEITDGTVVRMKKAYPVYDQEYHDSVQTLRTYLSGFSNLQTVGRNGLHRYNNQDHSMMTGVMAARNIVDGTRLDVWSVNTEKSYHEEVREAERPTGDRLTPTLARREPARLPAEGDEVLASLYSRLDPLALGVALGCVAGLILFVATAVLLLRGGEVVGPSLVLLAEYLWGYSVTWPGAAIGLAEGAIGGFVIGYFIAFLRNTALHTYLTSIRKKAELAANPDLLDKV